MSTQWLKSLIRIEERVARLFANAVRQGGAVAEAADERLEPALSSVRAVCRAYEDAERAWTYLVAERRIAPATIVIYGHSLGGVVAIDLASKHADAGALITESTLTSIADLADGMRVGGMRVGRLLPVRLILTERFDALSRIRAVHVPTLILQGQEDTSHLTMGQHLYDAANDPKQRVVIPGGGHNDSAEVNPTAYFAALNGFLSRYGLARE